MRERSGNSLRREVRGVEHTALGKELGRAKG